MAARLNPAQRAAVEHEEGPLLVLAGAGSGKTRVIIQRIARLIAHGVPPKGVLAVSFTNKAAREMVERLSALVGPDEASKVWLSTFHSFGVRFLNEESKRLGYGGRFVIFDQGDCIGLVREIVRTEGIADRRLDLPSVISRISLWKNRFLEPHQVPESDYEYDVVAREVYPHYLVSLRTMRAVDFDDLVVAPVKILRDHPDVRAKWRRRFQHLLVDEFQDTNHAQLELVRQLANRRNNVCVVGDDDQSIYGWRGAEVGNILDFEKHFPGTKVVKLEENYRSRSEILDVANSVIAASSGKRHLKTLRSFRGEGQRVFLCVTPDAEAEAKAAVQEMKRLAREDHMRWAECAVLYRSNAQARLIEEQLRLHGIPYQIYGGTQFFDRKEVKDAISYLRVVVNARDELSLRRIINYPSRGAGATTVERLAEHAEARRMTMTRALGALDGVDIPEGARRGLTELHGALSRAQRRFQKGERIAEAARQLFSEVGLERDLKDEKQGSSATRRWDNVEFLLRSITRFEANEGKNKPTLGQFLTRITLRDDGQEAELGNRVILSTLHAAKGLEFGTVFFIGCVEGQIPHSRTTDPKATEAAPTDVEEERRLFYVGVTRAKDRLYLTRPLRRSMRGRVIPLTPSRFLEGLPATSTEERELEPEPALGSEELADMTASLLERLGAGGAGSSQ